MAIEVRRASRKKVRMRLGLCAPAGGGKTMGALLVAYGLVGDWGRIGLVDSEAGSGELYTGHRVPGSTFVIGEYLYVRLEPPFTVAKYMEAQQALEDAGAECIILDSISHAWSGAGGLLDQQGKIADRTGNSYTAWRGVTPMHNRFVEGMLQSPSHIIATMRSKTEYVLEANDKGKQAPRKVGMAPVQREGLDFEFTTILDLDAQHMAAASKDRTSLFDGEFFRLTPETGKKMLAWLNTGIDVPKPRQWLDSGTESPVRAAAASMAPAPVVRGEEWLDDSIPALDDFDAPPSVESAPRSMRDQINEAVPMRAITTVGLLDLELPDPREHTQHGTIDTSGRWKAWTAKVNAALDDTSSRAEVEAIASHPVVADATASGPAWVRRDLSAMLAAAWSRDPG